MNHWRNALMIGMDHSWSKEIQVYSNKVPRVMHGPTPGDLTFNIVTYRAMLKNLLLKNH